MIWAQSQGFSLAEMMIGSALMGGIVLMTMNLSSQINKELSSIEDRANNVTDQFEAGKIITNDCLNAAPSFNYLKSNNGFDQKSDFGLLAILTLVRR